MAPASLPLGKLPPALLQELLAELGPLPEDVLLGPAVGEDACALRVPAGVLVAATDPITLTGSGIGAHAVVVNANDVAVMGVRPRWFLAVVLLPEGSEPAEVRALFASLRAELAGIGAALVGGHTEITACVRQPLVVGQMLGVAPDGRFVRTGGVRPGDVVVQVGRAPVEGAVVLATELADRLERVAPEVLAAARGGLRTPGISVVEPALLAAELGATAMHDPTEGGLSSGLLELAGASGVRLRVDPAAVAWFEPGCRVCRELGADPWGTLASGALLAAFAPDAAESAIARLRAAGFETRPLGVAEAGAGVQLLDGAPLPAFERDEVARVLESSGR